MDVCEPPGIEFQSLKNDYWSIFEHRYAGNSQQVWRDVYTVNNELDRRIVDWVVEVINFPTLCHIWSFAAYLDQIEVKCPLCIMKNPPVRQNISLSKFKAQQFAKTSDSFKSNINNFGIETSPKKKKKGKGVPGKPKPISEKKKKKGKRAPGGILNANGRNKKKKTSALEDLEERFIKITF